MFLLIINSDRLKAELRTFLLIINSYRLKAELRTFLLIINSYRLKAELRTFLLRRFMSKKGKALIVVAAALFLALACVGTYFMIYFRFVIVPSGLIDLAMLLCDSVIML